MKRNQNQPSHHKDSSQRPQPGSNSNMQILENLLQTRKSMEVKKVEAMIAAANNRDEQEHTQIKFNLIRNSLEFQMSQVLQDVDPKSGQKLPYKIAPRNDSNKLNVSNLRGGVEKSASKQAKQQDEAKPKQISRRESILRQSRDIVSQSMSSNSFRYESDEEEEQQINQLKLNLNQDQKNFISPERIREGINNNLAMRMQKYLRERTNNAVREAVKGPNRRNKSADEQQGCKHKVRRCCQGLKDSIIEKEVKQEQKGIDEYSVGEDETEFDVPLQFLSQDEMNERSKFLWHRCYLKAKGAAKIKEKFDEVHRKIMIFGTTKNINFDPTKEEREAFLKKKPIILLPDSQIKRIWNFVIIFLLAYTASFVPVKTAFFDDDPPGLYEFELFLDCLFYLDLFIQFISAYEDPITGFIEVRFTCIPFQLIQNSSDSSGGKNVKLLRLTRLPRLYRLLRILRLFKMFQLFKYNKSFRKYIDALKMNQGMMRMVQVTGGVFFMVHLMACFWFLSAKFNDFEYDCWVMARQIEDMDDGYQYLTSVYWALQTITTVGYGDIAANTQVEQILSILWMVFGVGFYSFTIGNLSSVIASMDTKNSILKQKLTTLSDFSKRILLPPTLEQRIKRFLENNNKDITSIDDQERLLNELPPSLKSEVVSHTHGNIISGIKFFQDKNPDFLWQVLPLLKNMKIYKGDTLYSQGDHADEIYFILKGSVIMHIDLHDPTINPSYQPKQKTNEDEEDDDDSYNVPFNLYVEGSYFGDSDCLFQRRLQRECMAEADQECHLLVIKKGALEDLLDQFQDIKTQMQNIALEKRKYHRRLIQELLRKYREGSQENNNNNASERNILKKDTSPDIMRYKSLKRRKTFKNKNGTSVTRELLGSPESSKDYSNEGTEEQEVNAKNEFFPRPKMREQQIPIITYSEGMKHVINQFKDKNTPQQNTLRLPPINSPKNGENAKKKSDQEQKLEQLEREVKKLEILNDSEAYYEKNLNAFNNNMSLLALNTYEISQLMSNLNRDNQNILNIAKNIQVHTSFISRKSEDLKRKVLLLADKINRQQQQGQQ
ncbi:cation channel family protein [Stylonychia lemnae]|uniref:Cation channel family protein n=1 Tax=Stylonychia lemnae TaxID=5949 RepID=A0A077ZPY5_STYLE|nr:cation channel family protein [Stylonychia lemnae]|eukprot:CDW71963.1 cation channel family protein [Stylonychia lemnae]